MLDPNARSLLIDALRPPPGHTFSAGIALTYSLDLTTLLTVPLHLALLNSGRRDELIKDPVALLESLRRTTSKLVVVCQQGRIAAPGVPHVLYGLMEQSVIEVNAPHGGVFHPKLWVLRFEDSETEKLLIRVIVLSRNLTPDRSWDLSLTLEGEPQGRAVAGNRAIAELLSAVQSMAVRDPQVKAADLLNTFANEVARVRWDELPSKFDEVRFQVLGLQRRPWKLERSDRLAVISPFVRANALQMLMDSTDEAVALVSRPEELAQLAPATIAAFGKGLILHDQAETDDGEDTSDDEKTGGSTPRGLHAKAYIAERGWYTALYLGSANATNASLLSGGKVEILAELIGKTSRVGGIDDLLGADGLQDYLTEFVPPSVPPDPTLQQQAQAVLDAARDAITEMGIRITCEGSTEQSTNDAFYLRFSADTPAELDQIVSLRLWPVSLASDRSTDAIGLARDGSLRIGPMGAASLTGFTAFELRSDVCDLGCCFVLNLPVMNMPEVRDAAILRTIISNREGFLRYLLLLLQEDASGVALAELTAALGGGSARWRTGFSELPLLEELTRAYSRDPQRLLAIRRIVDELLSAPNGRDVVPREFLEVWDVFASVLEELQPASSPAGKNASGRVEQEGK